MNADLEFGIEAGQIVRVGNGPEHFKVTEIVSRNHLGPRVANLFSMVTKEPRTHVALHELLIVEAAT